MLVWRNSPNSVIFLNEYWLLIPATVLIDYVIIRKIKDDEEKIKLLEDLKNQIEYLKRQRKIYYLTLGLSLGLNATGFVHLLLRGGSEMINVDYIQCGIDEGLRYLNDKKLRRIVHQLNKHKRYGKIIYITATALCHVANLYGEAFLDFPILIGDFGVTSLYHFIRKTIVMISFGTAVALYVAKGLVASIFGFILITMGLRLGFQNSDSIPTSPVFENSIKKIQPRIPGELEVVVVNYRNKIVMRNLQEVNKECLLPDQMLFNSKCTIKPTDIPNAIDLVSHDLNYDDIVNMKDITGLENVEFTDVLDLGKTASNIAKTKKWKIVDFLDKFRDPEIIDETELWDVDESKALEIINIKN